MRSAMTKLKRLSDEFSFVLWGVLGIVVSVVRQFKACLERLNHIKFGFVMFAVLPFGNWD